jgi:hypothetical protein
MRITSVLLVVIVCFSALQAQNQTPAAAAQGFYRWYFGELNADRFPIDRNRPEMRRRVSARLARWLFSPAYREYGADYFLDAQDFDRAWWKTLTVTPGKTTGNTAIVTVTMPKTDFFDRKIVTVTMVREAGAWKIDKVKGH